MEIIQPDVVVRHILGDIWEGSIYDLELGDIINFGSGPAVVTVINPRNLFCTAISIHTDKGQLPGGLYTKLMLWRPRRVEPPPKLSKQEVMELEFKQSMLAQFGPEFFRGTDAYEWAQANSAIKIQAK